MKTTILNGRSQHKVTHTIELTKKVTKRLNPDKVKAQINDIKERAVTSSRSKRGWRVNSVVSEPSVLADDGYIYTCKMVLTCEPKRERTADSMREEFNTIVKIVGTAGNSTKWTVSKIDNGTVDASSDERLPRAVGYVPVEVPDNWRDNFTHIYERDNQIDIIMSAINASIQSGFQDRFHCALVGDPACGKTETLRSVKAVVGEEAVLEYDATATTQAGAIKDLNDRQELPRILIVEEIEKTDDNSLRWLLSVLDHRAEIRKTTYRDSIQKETRFLALATVNDYDLFNKIMYGALASRFAYHLHFPQPDRNLLELILKREINRVHGDKRWIKPTLDFAVEHKIHDPRKVTAICLCGKDDLFDGTYQTKLLACSPTNMKPRKS